MEQKSFKEYLESVPPGKPTLVDGFSSGGGSDIRIATPQLQIHCSSDECQGIRFFESKNHDWLGTDQYNQIFLTYNCRNCRKSFKTYALEAVFRNGQWVVLKYGENPFFGPPIPARAFKLIGGERELFFLGRRNENQGMGIGAFVYYRRVIESQKNRIFDELIRVISKIGPDEFLLQEIEAAKNETQFTRAVESIKKALPESLNINGHNPLTLLHSALSEGVHNHTDSECLELAGSIRTVLFEFAEKLGQALKEEAELNAAISKLTEKKKDG